MLGFEAAKVIFFCLPHFARPNGHLMGVDPMEDSKASFRIALVGGEEFCKEVLQKYLFARESSEFAARIVAVADPDPQSPGMALGRKLGLITLQDYHELYDRTYDIKALVLMTPDEAVLDDVLKTKPGDIRLVAYPLSRLFWSAIDAEHRKLRARNEEIETILNSIQDFILVISPTMKIEEVNQAFLEHMGYSRDDVIGKKCYDVFQKLNAPCHSDFIGCPLTNALQTGRPNQLSLTRLDHGCQGFSCLGEDRENLQIH